CSFAERMDEMQYRSAVGVIAVTALLAVLAGGPQPAQAAFEIGQNFTGASAADAEFGSFPPDTMGAVGPNHFVEILNGRFAVYNNIHSFGPASAPHPGVDYDNTPSPEQLYSVFNDQSLKRAQIVGRGEGNALSVESGFLNVPPFAEAGTAHQPGPDDSIDAG